MLNFTVWIKTAVPWGAVMNQTQLVLLGYEAGAFGDSSWWVWSCCSWMTWLPHDGARKKKNVKLIDSYSMLNDPKSCLWREIFSSTVKTNTPLCIPPGFLKPGEQPGVLAQLEAVPFWAIVVESITVAFLQEPNNRHNLKLGWIPRVNNPLTIVQYTPLWRRWRVSYKSKPLP